MVDVDISKLYLLTKRKSCSTLTTPPISSSDKSLPSAIDAGTKLRKSASTLVKHRSSVSEALFPDKSTSKTAKAPPSSPTAVFENLSDVSSSYAVGANRGTLPVTASSHGQGSLKVLDPVDGKGRRGSTVARWFKHITDAADAYKGKDAGRNRKQSGQQTHPPTSADSQLSDTVSSSGSSMIVSRSESDKLSRLSYDHDASDDKDAHNTSGGSVESLETIGQGVEVLHIEAPRLVQPNEVVVSRTVCIEKLDPIVSPAEMLNLKCDLISRTLAEKKLLMADILQIPAQDYDHIAEMVDEVAEPKEVKELLLSTVTQADLLTQLINERLAVENVVNTHPADDVLVTTERTNVPDTSMSSNPASGELLITVPGTRLLSISTRLHRSLTLLVEATTRLALENERLRSELGYVQGQLAEIHAAASTEELRSLRSRSNSQSLRDDNVTTVTTSGVDPTATTTTTTVVTHSGGDGGDSRPQSFVSVMSSASESNDSSAAERLVMELNEESDHVQCTTASLVTVPVVAERLEIIEAVSQPFVVDPSAVIVSSAAVRVVGGDVS